LQWDRASQKELLRYSARSHPDLLFQQVILRSDYLFIGALLGSTALGHYAMASAAAELLLIVPEAVTTPLMKRLLQQGDGIERLTPLALRLTATVMLGSCLSMALIGEWLIVTLFGAAYQPAYPALLALLPGLFGLCYASILRLDLLGKDRPGSISLLVGLGALLNLALNLLLIPTYGIVGAASASSIAYLAVTVALLVLYCRLSGVPVWQTLIILPSDLVPMRKMLLRRPA
jgi:O-antigen/teichoic acid export membrane protein